MFFPGVKISQACTSSALSTSLIQNVCLLNFPLSRQQKCPCLCAEWVWCALVAVSDEEEGGILFDNVAKSAMDPFDTSSGSVQLIAIKPVALPAVHAASERSQESAIINGEVRTGWEVSPGVSLATATSRMILSLLELRAARSFSPLCCIKFY